MQITTSAAQAGSLLLCGVPFGQGAAAPGTGFLLLDQASHPLPLWWEERAHWPDGSVKWIWLHARLSGDSGEVLLETSADGRSECHLPSAADRFELAGASIDFAHGGGWTFSASGAQVAVEPGPIRTDPALDRSGEYGLALVEASPIAPLLRWRCRGDRGVRFDHLIRLDPARAAVHWQQRISFLTAESCQLQRLNAVMHFADQQWSWPDLDAETSRLGVPSPGAFALDDGIVRAGHPRACLQGTSASVILEAGWQRAPFAMAFDGGRVDMEFYPESVAPLTVQGGTSFRHAVRIGLQPRVDPPARWSLEPEAASATGVFGPLMAHSEETTRLFPGYEQAMEACLHSGRLGRLDKEPGQPQGAAVSLARESEQDEEYFGLQHYGDWPMKLGSYGGTERMYADNEYDTPFAYFLQFARTGIGDYAGVAYHSAVHMADVDSKATDGDMHFHGYREQAEDHADHRTRGGDSGHYWTDGMVLNYLLMGDLWSWEAARAQAGFLLRLFAGDGDDPIRQVFLGCERSVGWPLVALMGVLEATGDPELLNKARQMSGFLSRFAADPDRELEEITHIGDQPLKWWRICQADGTKPFMLGVVLEGLERLHRYSGDRDAERAILSICRFLVDVMWVEDVGAFIYEWNAFNRGHRHGYPHYINMMVAPGLAYAYELSGEEVFREVATRSFHAALWTLFSPGGGKEIGMVGRTSATMVSRLHDWRSRGEAARAARMSPSPGIPFAYVGSPADLAACDELAHCGGTPAYRRGALISSQESYAVYDFRKEVATCRGDIAFTFTPAWDCPPHPGPVSQRAYLHLSDEPFTRSSVSVISFYIGLHVRFYDAERNLIEVLETDIQHWKAGGEHEIRIQWDVEEDVASLWMDGEESDRRPLNRRLSGAFRRLHLGHRPGNWRADGAIDALRLELG